MVETFQDLTEGTLAYLFYDLETETYLVILRNPIVAISIIVAVIDYSFSFSGMNLEFIGGKIKYFFKFLYLGDLGLSQELWVVFGGLGRAYWILNPAISSLTHILNGQLFPLRSLRDYLTLFLLGGCLFLTAISS